MTTVEESPSWWKITAEGWGCLPFRGTPEQVERATVELAREHGTTATAQPISETLARAMQNFIDVCARKD